MPATATARFNRGGRRMRVVFLGSSMMGNLSVLTVFWCLLISLVNQNSNKTSLLHQILTQTNNPINLRVDYPSSSSTVSPPILSASLLSRLSLGSRKLDDDPTTPESLEYDYYRKSCPQAEQIIRAVVQELNTTQPETIPALLRLVFHDCFVEGCDASLLLDVADGAEGEREASPNESLKGFDIIDLIKAELEDVCPGVVSCADVLVLSAREAVVLNRGPFYPLLTGRRDSTLSFPEVAEYELPSPQDDLETILAAFASRRFDKREAVALLGAHGMGVFHCMFFFNRLYFNKVDNPDPSVNTQFLNLMRSTYDPNNNALSILMPPPSPTLPSPSPSPSSSPPSPLTASPPHQGADEAEIMVDHTAPTPTFNTFYPEEQLKAEAETSQWIRTYTSDVTLFQQDFALAMMKLSNLSVLAAPLGQVLWDCRRVAA